MRRLAFVTAVLAMLALSVSAIEPGRAEGSLTINGTSIPLAYAYAAGHQKNDISQRDDDVKIVLTDKPLAADGSLDKIPPDVVALVLCIDPQKRVTHAALQHAAGTWDGGWFEDVPQYRYKAHRAERGVVAGEVSTAKDIVGATVTFKYDVSFAATLR